MGLGNVFLNDLIELKLKGALDGATRVMEIGAQQISDSLMIAPELPEAYRLFGFKSLPAATFAQYPLAGSGMAVRRHTFAKPTSEIPKRVATSDTGASHTRR